MASKKRGKLYVFEGPNDVGKSLLSSKFAEEVESRNRRVWVTAFPGNEEGSLGAVVYGLHRDPSDFGISSMDPLSLQMLHVAAHVDAVRNRIIPQLNLGIDVVLDRYWWSTLIYGQVEGVKKQSLEMLIDLEKKQWQGVQPDLLFLVDRPEPFGGKPPEWDNLRKRYLRYCDENSHPHPVRIINNNSHIEKAVDAAITATEI